jgi:hypothetical protein
MYNNKQYRTAQLNLEDATKNIGEYLGNVGKNIPQIAKGLGLMGGKSVKQTPKAVEDLLSGDPKKREVVLKDLSELGYNIVNFLAPYVGGTKIAAELVKDMNLIPVGGIPGLHGLKGFGVGTAGFLGAEALMALGEEAKGDLAIYEDYYSDFKKNLTAIQKLFPKNDDLMNLIDLMASIGGQGLDAIIEGKRKIVKSVRKKNYKIAIVGEANWGSYLHNFLAGAASGAVTGGGVPGAAIAGGGFALADAGKDVAHHLRSKEYQAAAYSHELVEKTHSMVNQLKKYDPILAMQLDEYVKDFDLYVNKYIYEPKKKRSNSYLDLDYYQSLLDEKVFNQKKVEEPKVLLDYLKKIKSENETE